MLTIDMSAGHYAVVCNLNGHYAMGMHQDFNVVPAGSTPITVGLGETDATHMFLDLSQPYAPEGKVTFIITNQGAEDHEFVVLQTDTMAADFPIVGFEGEPNRFDEDAKGITNVGETGDPAMAPGTSLMLTIDMTAGHYAVVCNLNGHYAMGMHQDFNVVPAGSTPITVGLGETDATHMFIDLSQPYAPEGKVTFIITRTHVWLSHGGHRLFRRPRSAARDTLTGMTQQATTGALRDSGYEDRTVKDELRANLLAKL
jgi:uncharacterized cupredoxin-like copper-binding protein